MRRIQVGSWLAGGIGLVLIGQAAQAQQAPVYQQAQAPVYQQQQPQYPSSPEYYASNLGIYYRLVPYYGGGAPAPAPYAAQAPGTYAQAPVQAPYPPQQPQVPPGYGARLSRYPVPNSPAARLQLEPGDMIVSLDYQPINNPNDVLAHTNWTNMSFINIRTGLPQTANVYIP
jgi:membrane-associated protease RseP (regulator of RpoE activity)